ncbi:hypothetical protein Efla_007124 [Eimeria flavescens]
MSWHLPHHSDPVASDWFRRGWGRFRRLHRANSSPLFFLSFFVTFSFSYRIGVLLQAFSFRKVLIRKTFNSRLTSAITSAATAATAAATTATAAATAATAAAAAAAAAATHPFYVAFFKRRKRVLEPQISMSLGFQLALFSPGSFDFLPRWPMRG